MSLKSLTFLALWIVLTAPALGQPKVDEKDKLSNDRPDRPLQMPPASSEVKEAFDDFERFRKRGAWERAFKSLYAIPAEQASRFIDGRDGFIIPVSLKRRDVLAALPAEGQAAYRLFYDDEAKKLLAGADGESEKKTLERVVSAFFPTSVGDNAADRLGDFYFESGRFDRAADLWLAILRQHPDTDLSPALISLKAALALSRAGRRSELETLRREIADRYAGDKVAIAGLSAPAGEHLNRLLSDQAKPAAAPSQAAPEGSADPGAERVPDLARVIPAAWQMRFSDSVVAGMTPAERIQWDSNPLSGAVPPVAAVGSTLFANYLGYVFALNLDTGKLLWRSGSFHDVDIPAAQPQSRMIDPARFAIAASPRYVWALVRDMKDPNQMAPFRLTCRRTDGGDIVWQTTDLPDYGDVDLIGAPVLAGNTLFLPAKTPMQMMQQQGQAKQYLLAVRPDDGKLLWKAEVGTFRQAQPFWWYGMRDTSSHPTLLYQAGSVYFDSHEGVLARLDADSGEVEWGYAYETEASQMGGRFFFWGMMESSEPASSGGGPLRSGGTLFVKGAKSERIGALDPDRMTLQWDRPISKSARLLGGDDRAVFLGGPELSALDRQTRTLLWATRMPGGSAQSRVLVRPGGLWQLTPRGVFEVDPRSGRVRRIFRGDDTGSDGGDLYLTGRYLLAVSNRTISAYPVASPAAPAQARAGSPRGRADNVAATQTRARASHD
jgi:outer membrane protein assembly factor BamB